MQLQLNTDERQLLADILEQTRYSLMQGAELGQLTEERSSKARECEELFARVVEKRLQFSTDELDALSVLLRNYDRELEQGAGQEQKRQLLQSLTDKIVEICVMF